MMNHEGLQIEKPECGQEHCGNQYGQKRFCQVITKRGQDRKTEHGEIRNGAQCRQRERTYMRVRAAEDFVATGNDCAAQTLAGEVLDGEIDRVTQTYQRYYRGDEVWPGYSVWRVSRRHRFANGYRVPALVGSLENREQ